MKKILLILLTFIYSFSVELTTKVLEPNEAFKTSFTKNQDSLTLKLELGKDIYLYDDKLKILIKKPQEVEITKEINIPKAVAYEEYIVHFDNLNLTIPFDLLKSKIEDLEKKNFEVLGQFSELKNLIEKRETEFAQVSEVLEKSKTLESEFENAKEAVLKNIELKQATTYWEEQAEKYDKKYKYNLIAFNSCGYLL